MNEEEAIENVKKQLEGIKKANECGLATRGEFNKDIEAIETVLNLIEKQEAEIEEKDREIIRCSRAANEYKKAVKCKECDCCICEAHINTLELSAEIEKKDKEIKCLKCLHNTQVEIIDLMAEEFVSKTLMYSDMTKEEVKQYFENKAEEDK